MIDLGSDLDFTDLWSSNFLFYCAEDSHLNLFTLLMRRGVKIDQPNVYGQTVLFILAQRNCVNILKQLLKDKSVTAEVVNQVDELGRSALFYAAEEGHKEACRVLLMLGGEIFSDHSKRTPISYVKKRGFEELDSFLTYHKEHKKKEKKRVAAKGTKMEEEPEYYNLSFISEDLQTSTLTVGEVLRLIEQN